MIEFNEELARELAESGLLDRVCDNLQSTIVMQWATMADETARTDLWHKFHAIEAVRHAIAGELVPPEHELHAQITGDAGDAVSRFDRFVATWRKRWRTT